MHLEGIRKRGDAELPSKRGTRLLAETKINRLDRDPILRERDRSGRGQHDAGAASRDVHHAQVDASANPGRIREPAGTAGSRRYPARQVANLIVVPRRYQPGDVVVLEGDVPGHGITGAVDDLERRTRTHARRGGGDGHQAAIGERQRARGGDGADGDLIDNDVDGRQRQRRLPGSTAARQRARDRAFEPRRSAQAHRQLELARDH